MDRTTPFPQIRPACLDDRAAVIDLFQEVVGRADSFSFDPNTDREGAEAIWFAPDAHVYVAQMGPEGPVLGSCFIKPNQPGLGNHVANGGFMVAGAARGKGLGRALGEFAIVEAARLGFSAMQFNFVVVSNEGAVKLWLELGFAVVGRIPQAFRHGELGLTDVLIMHRRLDPAPNALMGG